MPELSIKQFIKALRENQVKLAYLFGSQARGEAHKESDIDIAVLFDEKLDPKKCLQKEGALIGIFSELYPKKEINIVNLNISSPLLKQTANLEGIPIYAQSADDEISFQIQTLREYEEYCHLSNIYNQFLKLRIQNL